MTETINFTIRPDFILRYNQKDYTYKELAQSVGYWVNYLNQIPDIEISLAHSGLSFSAVSLVLALYITKRSHSYLRIVAGKLANNLPDNPSIHRVFILGETNHDPKFQSIPYIYVRTDSWHHSWGCATWDQPADLSNIPFSKEQIISAYTSGTTSIPTLTTISAYTEAESIKVAQELFYEPNDYCVFLHGMAHKGVHTTAILPALFTARVLSLTDASTWDEEINKATITQYFYTMMKYFALPKKIRTIITGGDMLKPELYNKIATECKYDHLYDVYGLTECLPPLAIRDVQQQDDLSLPFIWVNKYYTFVTDDNNNIIITRSDEVIYKTSDRAIKDGDLLYFKGRQVQHIRVNGILTLIEQFKNRFEKETKIVNYVLNQEVNGFVLYALTTDKDIVSQYIEKNQVEVSIVYQDILPTNGGIKHVK
jgi:AMP-binding enzyme